MSYIPNIGSPIVPGTPQNYGQHPNFSQTSPMTGYYPCPPKSFTNLQPIQMQSTFNNGNDQNTKIDGLAYKIDEMCKKLSSLDILSDKINKFEKTMSSLVSNVESVTKRVGEVEKS